MHDGGGIHSEELTTIISHMFVGAACLCVGKHRYYQIVKHVHLNFAGLASLYLNDKNIYCRSRCR